MCSSWICLLALTANTANAWRGHPNPPHVKPSWTRSASYSTYVYMVETTTRYATPLPSPLALTTTYAPAYSQASGLLPTGVLSTTYSLNPDATNTDDGRYGQSAYARLWDSLSYNVTIPFTTTASPTPVASSELVFPPELYYSAEFNSDVDCYTLPKDFIWGVAGSAWQIEGGLKFAGRGPSVLDVIGALPNADGLVNGEVTNMNYFLYKQDIMRLAAMGIPYYSFSIAWTRIVPFGEAGSPVNTLGLDHYDDVINTCLEHGIAPIVTLQHFDNPFNVSLSDPRYPDAFLYYAQQVMTRYGDRVKYWVTLNEPNLAFQFGYNGPPTPYSAIGNILNAHAKVYHWYKEELKGTGSITIKFAHNLGLPLNGSSAADMRATRRYNDFIVGGMGNPIYLGAQLPAEMLLTTTLNIPALSASELAFLNGTSDFYAMDPYVSQFVAAPAGGLDACIANASDPLYPTCVVTTNEQADGWLMGQASYGYAYLAPQYVRQQLGYAWNTFRPKGILIAEFGFNPWAEWTKPAVDQRYDLERTLYYAGFLREMLRAMFEDGVKVVGALGWSFVDNNEFGSVTQQYGVQLVNRTDGRFTRSFKRSLFDYVDFFHRHVRSERSGGGGGRWRGEECGRSPWGWGWGWGWD